MADGTFVGAAPGTFITELPEEEQERRASPASQRKDSAQLEKRKASILQVINVLHGGTKNPNLRPGSGSFSDYKEEVYRLKQAQGETHAQGGDTRWYKPIDSYEGRHRWDPLAEWTEKEERKIV